LFLVASGAWFYRIAFVLSLLLFKGPFGFDPVTFTGLFPIIMSFAQYLFPLAILEIYLRAGPPRRATAHGDGRHSFCTHPRDGRFKPRISG